MNELNAILRAGRGLDPGAADAVLATIVHVSGSAYRRPGARMLVLPDGSRVGSVSGGCLEGEVTKKAAWLTRAGRPVVQAYDTSADSQGSWEFGLGCNGIVQILLERVAAAATGRMLDFVDSSRRAGATAAVATVVACADDGVASVGDRVMIDSRGRTASVIRGDGLAGAIGSCAERVLAERRSAFVHLGGADVFVEFIAPPLSLVVFGAGDDARPLAAIGSTLGWDVTIADGRPAYARADRFPGAERVVLLPRGDLLRDIAIDGDAAVVMMTHNFRADLQLLPLVLARRPRYLGLLGPRSRADLLFEEAGLEPPAYLHAPVGLDVGGDTPASTALAIVGEIQAVVNGRDGGRLRDREGAIHDTVREIGDIGAVPVNRIRPVYCETVIGSHV